MDLAAWVPFFTAAAGASAALVGLLIVAMSVNVEAIVAAPSMPSRALATIAGLTVVVVVAVLGNVPGIGPVWLGLVLLLCALAALAFAVDALVRLLRAQRAHDPGSSTRSSAWVRGVAGMLPIVLMVVAGVLLLAGVSAAGLVVAAVGFALVFVTSVLNAWVLLIEIRR